MEIENKDQIKNYFLAFEAHQAGATQELQNVQKIENISTQNGQKLYILTLPVELECIQI